MRFAKLSSLLIAFSLLALCQVPPASPEDAFRLGEAFLQQRNYQSAAAEFHRALSGSGQPGQVVVSAHIGLGKVFEMTGQTDRAASEYELAVQAALQKGISPDEPAALLRNLGGIAARSRTQSDTADLLPLPPGAFRVMKGVSAPVLIEKVEPDYTEHALLAQLEGVVWLTGLVNADGTTSAMQVTGRLGLGLDEKALEAVKRWRFKPGIRMGQAVSTFVTVPVPFVLASKRSRWHLVRVEFSVPNGTFPPAVLKVTYPAGAGVAPENMDAARVVAAMGRQRSKLLAAGDFFRACERGVLCPLLVP